jgi:hypothetical protein
LTKERLTGEDSTHHLDASGRLPHFSLRHRLKALAAAEDRALAVDALNG